MPKLTTLKPRLTAMRPKLKAAREIRDRRHSPDATVRGWYHSARWQELRQAVLVRDVYTCQQTGVLLIGKYPSPTSPVVDHVVPHRGDEQLFWDIGNLQAVSKAYHDSDKRKMEMSQ